MLPHKLHNGHLVYTCNEPSQYHMDFRLDFEACWESVSYVAEKAYDARDVAGLFFDGVTIVVLNHYDVPVPVIFLVGGILLGAVMLHKSKKERKE